MRVVLDTNVIVSAALTVHGPCARILDLVSEGVFEVYADERILDEYDCVLRRAEFSHHGDSVARVMKLVHRLAQPVAAIPLAVQLPDPDDLPFLVAAAAAEALLVTGNIRHFPRPARAGVAVMSPAEFLKLPHPPANG